MSWKETIFEAVMALGEQSDPGEVNPNTDGQGASYGDLQWTQKSGQLGELLERARRSFPIDFDKVFGPDGKTAISVALAGSLEPVAGAVLWAEPWLSRFRTAGKQRWMQVVQANHGMSGYHWTQAMKAARILDARTERGLALIFDRAVPAPGRVPKTAQATADWARGSALSEIERVAAFVGRELNEISDRYRSAHRARFDRILATDRLSDDVVVDWSDA